MQVSRIGITCLVISLIVGMVLTGIVARPWPLIVMALIGFYLLFAIRVADQWQKVVVLRFGRYAGLRGPGIFHIIPIVDSVSRFVDQRVRVANVSAESTSTR